MKDVDRVSDGQVPKPLRQRRPTDGHRMLRFEGAVERSPSYRKREAAQALAVSRRSNGDAPATTSPTSS